MKHMVNQKQGCGKYFNFEWTLAGKDNMCHKKDNLSHGHYVSVKR